MSPLRNLLSAVLFFVVPVSAGPTITNIANAAGNLPFNSPLAPGGIFILQGSGLGPSTISIASKPFQSTTLSGTSVSVTVGTTTVAALMYYTSDKQVAALLPSNTPTTGPGTFTVTYNGQTSNNAGHGIATANAGIFTIDSSGQGPGIFTYADYSLVSAIKSANCGGPNTTCGAANPGDTLIIWATGLGAVNGDDASGAGLGVNMPNLPLSLWVGGIKANVLYQGRSGCCVGEDQIVFTVPDNARLGCAVPVVIQIGTNANTISNSVVLPIAKGSRTCTPAEASLAQIDFAQAAANGFVSVADIKLQHFSDGGGKFEDDGRAQFININSFTPGSLPFAPSWVDSQPSGTCLVYNNLNENQNVPFLNFLALDAGAAATVKGPNGSVNLPSNGKDATFDASGSFLTPGSYTMTTPGGADVGPVSFNFTIPALPTLTSPVNNAAVTRSAGLPVTWTGGSGTLIIEIAAPVDTTGNNGYVGVCFVDAAAKSFTVPPYILLALPPTPTNFSSGFVLSSRVVNAFSASGLNGGSLTTLLNAAGFGFFWGSGGFLLR